MAVKLNVRMEMPGKEPKDFVYDFDQDVITLGRDSNNDIQIPLTTVSRNHGRITREGKDWFLEDLKSTHGTNHNGKPVGSGGKKLLRSGDLIELMHFRIQFEVAQDKPLELGQSERTEMLARRMVQEVLASIGGGSEAPYLRVMNGPEEGKRHELGDGVGEVVIGRAVECDFAINDANISRKHALVRKDWSGITIEDMGSKNGVTINEKKIDKASPLKDSDEIGLGAVKLVFIDPSASILGKLDDLPVFKEDAPAEEPAAEGSEEAGAEEPAAEPDAAAAPAGAPSGEAPAESAEGAAGGEPAAEGAAEDDDDAPKTKGAADYLVFAAVGLVVLGLVALGVVVATQL
jgi:pSer/pThr/pTyr-binding forkhead associated (FHA) protein